MNIFEIEKELLSIFSEIEENEGEITPEIENKLELAEDNFKSKIESYISFIKSIESNIELIDKELTRLQDLKKAKNKLKDKLSSIVINAVEQFGDTKPSGVKYYDYGIGIISVHNRDAIESNEESLTELSRKVKAYLGALDYSNQLNTISKIESSSFIDFCDTSFEYKGEIDTGESNAISINDSDLEDVKATITVTKPVSELLDCQGFNLLRAVQTFDKNFSIKTSVDKAKLKKDIDEGLTVNVGNKIINKKLSFK